MADRLAGEILSRDAALGALRSARAEAHKLALVAEYTRSGVLIADVHKGIEWINPSFTQITGFTLDDVQGQMPENVLRGPAEHQDHIDAVVQQIHRGEPTAFDAATYAKSGSLLWLSVDAQIVRDAQGQASLIIGILTDHTERRRVQEELRDREALLASI